MKGRGSGRARAESREQRAERRRVQGTSGRPSSRGRHWQAQEERADVPERQAWATRQGSGRASAAKGVGRQADWLGRPHLPRWASKFASLSDLQPHRCLHPITKQYLATSAVPGNQSRTEHRNRWAPRALWSRSDRPAAQTSTYIPAVRFEVPKPCTPQVAVPLSLPRLPCPTRSGNVEQPPSGRLPLEGPNFTMRCLGWDSMTLRCHGADEQSCRRRRSQPSETG